MLTSLNPVGEAARGQRWTVTVTAYLVASPLGGALVGGLLGAVAAPAARALGTTAALLVLALVAVVGLAVDAAPLRLPSWRRQVDERWLDTYRGWVYGGGFGLQLGAAVATIVPASITYVVLAAAALSGSAGRGAAVGAVFGLARALPVLATRAADTPQALRALHRRVVALDRPVRRTATAVQLGVAAVVLAVVLTGGPP
ncbi:MAG: sulfite exporter TauE/SafE family protein [Actinobacteria bacterium]|nr:sulfite exporter TauE/SafE family protein [Actinomycetota bacterium]